MIDDGGEPGANSSMTSRVSDPGEEGSGSEEGSESNRVTEPPGGDVDTDNITDVDGLEGGAGSASDEAAEPNKVTEPPGQDVKNTVDVDSSNKQKIKTEQKAASSKIPFLPTDQRISEKSARARFFNLQKAQSRNQIQKTLQQNFGGRDLGTTDSQTQAFIRRAKAKTDLSGAEARALTQLAESGASQKEIEQTLQKAGVSKEVSKLAGGLAQESLDTVNVARQGLFVAQELADQDGQAVKDVPSGVAGGAAALGTAFVKQPFREGIPEAVGLLTGGGAVTSTATTSSGSSLTSAVNPADQTTTGGFRQSKVKTPGGETQVQGLETAGPTSTGGTGTGLQPSEVPGNEQLPSGFTDQGVGRSGTTETVQESAVTGGNFREDVVKQRTPETQTQETGFGRAQGEAEFTGTGSEPSQVPTEETDNSLTVSKEEIETLAQRRERTSGADVKAEITGFTDENSKQVDPSDVKFTGTATTSEGGKVTLTEKLKKEVDRSLNSNTLGVGPGSLVPPETESTTQDKSSSFVEPDIGFGDTDTSPSPSIDPVDSSTSSTNTVTGSGTSTGSGTGTGTGTGAASAAGLSIDSGTDFDAPFEGQPQNQVQPQGQGQQQEQPQTQAPGQTASSTSTSTSFTAESSSFNFQQTPSTSFDTDTPLSNTDKDKSDSDFNFDLGGSSENKTLEGSSGRRFENERGKFLEADLVSQTLAKVQGEDTTVAFSEGRQSSVNLFGAPTKAEAQGRLETDLTGGGGDFDVDVGGDTL